MTATIDHALQIAAEVTALHADPSTWRYDRGRKLAADLAEVVVQWEPVIRAAKAWATYGRDDSDDEDALIRAVRALPAEPAQVKCAWCGRLAVPKVMITGPHGELRASYCSVACETCENTADD